MEKRRPERDVFFCWIYLILKTYIHVETRNSI